GGGDERRDLRSREPGLAHHERLQRPAVGERGAYQMRPLRDGAPFAAPLGALAREPRPAPHAGVVAGAQDRHGAAGSALGEEVLLEVAADRVEAAPVNGARPVARELLEMLGGRVALVAVESVLRIALVPGGHL